jgi:hypothetical protein
MWKQLTAALMILAFTSSVFCQTVILLDYYANKTAYAQNCINKARPKMHCNGKCQVMKKLEQEEKNSRDNQERRADNKAELIFADSFCRSGLVPLPSIPQLTVSNWVPKTVDRSYPLLRPPLGA